DEIGEMPMALQAKLLRVLQEGTLRAVGSDKEEHVNVRILAATHQDLEKKVENGSFRQDLFYRLETFSIRVPALRERGEDIERLVRHFANDIDSDALELLYRYPFPGNVRELQNAIERAVAFSQDGEVHAENLPQRITEFEAENEAESVTPASRWPTLNEMQEDYIKKVLAHVQGNKSKAAEVLGVTRRTLYRWLEDSGDREAD
ncbi:MAG TPA: sigma-54-dependent Fis family transcriptional regulator, partial [Idiomarina sp.]|nr:sigma-54-dependent Fis family transcriptional regulator [Idiomarina sp.]